VRDRLIIKIRHDKGFFGFIRHALVLQASIRECTTSGRDIPLRSSVTNQDQPKKVQAAIEDIGSGACIVTHRVTYPAVLCSQADVDHLVAISSGSSLAEISCISEVTWLGVDCLLPCDVDGESE
jgi:hypothetical protein